MPSLSQKVEQTLLADIEKTGLPLDQVSLVDLCDAKEGIYGAPGKSRRPVQLRFQKIKILTARGYKKLLVKHNITPGPASLAAEKQEQAQELPDQATAQDADEELVLLPAGTIQGHAIRLKPGEDLVQAMENAAAKAMLTSQTGSAFVLSVVGSVESLTLRMANAGRTEDGKSKVNDIKKWDERMEIVSLVGTFASNGKHLHMSVSDAKGHVYGGHLVSGRVFTTLELVLGTIQNVRFDREMDESTGYNELAVRTSKT